jgi:hypothetical protein
MEHLLRLLVSLAIPALMLTGMAVNPALAQDKTKDVKAAAAAKAEKGKPTLELWKLS